jgi:predicted nucleic acid-binding OB-fold protein
MSSIYLIGLANISWYNEETSSAKRNLELVILEIVELSYHNFVSLFYYHTKIKISYSESDRDTNISSFLVLEKLIKKTGFTKFREVSKKYTLN